MSDAVGTAFVRIKPDTSGFQAGITSGLIGPLKGVGAALAAAFSVKKLLVEPLSAAGDFTQTLSVLGATTNATKAELAKLSATAITLGKDTKLPGTSAQQAATAMLELAKGGFTVKQSMEAARATLQLSAAAQIGNAESAQYLTRTLNAFGLSAKDAARVTDLLAGAANASSADIPAVAQALAQVGAAANDLHVPVEQVVASIAQLADAGIQGSDAGTTLKTALNRLNPTTKDAANLIDKLGLRAFDASGTFIGLPNVVKKYSAALKGMSDEQRQSTLLTIFGTDAQRAASIVLGGGAKAHDQYVNAITKVGSAQKLAEAQTVGWNGAVLGFKNTIETLQLELGLKLQGPATATLNAITSGLDTAAGAISDFADLATRGFGAALAFLDPFIEAFKSGGLDALIARVKVELSGLSDAGKGLATLAAVFIAPLVAGFVPLIAAVVLVVKHFDELKAAAVAGFAVFKTDIVPVIEETLAVIGRFAETVAALPWEEWGIAAQDFATAVGEGIQGIVEVVGPIVADLAAWLGGLPWAEWGASAAQFTEAVVDGIEAVAAFVGPLVAQLAAWLGGLPWAEWGASAAEFGSAVVAGVQVVADIFTNTVLPAIQSFIAWAMPQLRSFGAFVQEVFDGLKGPVTAALGAISTVVAFVFGNIKTIVKVALAPTLAAITAFITVARALWEQFGGAITSIVSQAFNTIRVVVASAVAAIAAIIRTVLAVLNGDWGEAWSQMGELVRSVLTGLGAIVTGSIGIIRTAISALAAGALAALVAGLKALPGAMRTAIGLLAAAVGGLAGVVGSALTALAGAAVRGLESGLKALPGAMRAGVLAALGLLAGLAGAAAAATAGIGAAIIDGMVSGVRGAAGRLASAARDAVGSAVDAAKSKLGIGSPSRVAAAEIGEPIVAGITQGINKLAPDLRKKLSQTVRDAVDAAKQNARGLAESLSSIIGSVLDARLKGQLSGLSAELKASLAVLDDSPEAKRLRELNATLASEARTKSVDDAASAVTDARGALAKAETPEDKIAAQKRLDDALEAQRTLALRNEQSDLEDALARKRAILEQTNADAQASAQKLADDAKAAVDRQLADLTASLNQGLISRTEYEEKIRALLASQGADYARIGGELGQAFADSFQAALSDLLLQIAKIANGPQIGGSGLGGDITDPLKGLREQIAESKKSVAAASKLVAKERKEATSKSGASGEKITKGEQAQIDAAKRQQKTAEDQLAALQKLLKTIAEQAQQNASVGGTSPSPQAALAAIVEATR